jgi:hypothetical protein
MAVEHDPLWVAVCTNTVCPLFGVEYPCDNTTIECGGCNIVYEKPR